LFLYVLVPVDGLLVLGSALLGFFWAGDRLAHVGALEPGSFGGAVYLAGAFLLLGLALRVLIAGWNLLRHLSGETRPLAWPLRRPWWTFGVVLLLACGFFMPTGSRQSGVPGLVGALILATSFWCVCASGYFVFAVTWRALAFAWRLARASPFAAGLLTVGALACVGFMALLGAMREELPSRVKTMPGPRRGPSCDASALECTRRMFLASGGSKDFFHPDGRAHAPSSLAASSGSLPEASSRGGGAESLETRSSTGDHRVRECLDSQYKNRDLLEKAWRIAASRVGGEDAWDLVHTTLLSVCLRSGERYDFERFFLRSIDHAVNSWFRRPGNVRTCTLDSVPDPVCDIRPDDLYVRSETQETVRKALCSLSDEDRRVLVLRYFDDLSDLEVAERLGVNPAAARKRLQRAREKLEVEFLQRCQ